MIVERSSVLPVEVFPGVIRRTLAYSDKAMLVEYSMKAGSVFPWHSHPHEQLGYLVSGKLTLEWGKEKRTVSAGHSWVFPGGVPHQVTVLEDAVALDFFTPSREEFIPKDESEAHHK